MCNANLIFMIDLYCLSPFLIYFSVSFFIIFSMFIFVIFALHYVGIQVFFFHNIILATALANCLYSSIRFMIIFFIFIMLYSIIVIHTYSKFQHSYINTYRYKKVTCFTCKTNITQLISPIRSLINLGIYTCISTCTTAVILLTGMILCTKKKIYLIIIIDHDIFN